ncbi:cell surface glycoprotein CD200 receptor 1-like [Cheilinus undulatus]|uniref:cell surface glycoprotein CD200 receptor 1-like n=1 Tax=Cheilinus undulatus TaxID=241271 RepID=UPI001BD616F6|nr:cell surface glycoprotein CD200 receptor 1-like [Cheilinus undulatus]
MAAPVRVTHAVRNSSFKEGSDVNLTCSDRTWNQMIFVSWEIMLRNRSCRVAFNSDGQSLDTCNDGKTLRNTSSSQSYLHIPKFSNGDDGVYTCQSVYNGGFISAVISVDIIVPPSVSTWLERQDNKLMAVCKANRGKPAASISWSHAGNSSLVETLDSNGFYTAESRLLLPDGGGNLSCIIRHLYWEEEKIFIPEIREGVHPWFHNLLVLGVALILPGLCFFVIKLKRRCQQSDI